VACHQTDFNNTTDPNHQGANFPTDCASCHTTDPGWMPAEFLEHDASFFPIYSGSHQGEWDKCSDCHSNSSDYGVFSCTVCHLNPETNNEHDGITGYVYEDHACLACHPNGNAEDGFDHNNTGFPLTGAHLAVACIECHADGYAGTPTDCAACHIIDYNQSTNPNHGGLGFPTDCAACHTTGPGWAPATFGIHNNYYPLNGAHAQIANDCAACHNGDYSNTPNTCAGCHLDDYNQTTSPDHQAAQFSTDCAACHSENSWEPATFDHDGQYFPIYSGKHDGEWDQCTDCHTNPSDYSVFTCLTCHTNPETDDHHDGVGGYSYNSDACLACHPTGDADFNFDHNNTLFPLTGSHNTVACIDCHSSGFQGTPTECVACHAEDFNQTTNPDHNALGLSNDCAMCHTTAADWEPASFPNHYNFYQLNGAHAAIANDCAACHNGNYNNTPNTCFGCHQTEYNNTINPDHQAAQFPTDCASCHTENAWEPSTFDHDGMHFPIYTGSHNGEWGQCSECHTNPSNFAEFTCITCHTNPETNNQHNGVGGYSYNSQACLACHPTGDSDVNFDHNSTDFPLTGAHIGPDCIDCHSGGYQGTPTDCYACHATDYDLTLNPHHYSLGIPTDCATCHYSTAPGWEPATFPMHDNFYPLTGAHTAIANDCDACHDGDYINTPTSCQSCHAAEYSATTNPNHGALAFPLDCAMCHTTAPDWMPATFPIHNNYYQLLGAHTAIANDCAACHNGNYNNTPNTCFGCHQSEYNNTTNPDHQTAQFPTDCASCHTENAWEPSTFDHDNFYPLTGAHIPVENDCNACHINGNYSNTPNTCNGCHTPEYAQSTNPDHVALGLPTDCAMCHTTAPDWMPATFPIHNNYYQLLGAHAAIANDCAACHNGNYNNTPNTCFGCHQTEYNNTINPDHQAAQFPTDCASCHTQNTWSPSTWEHDGQYFPIYSGKHKDKWDLCVDCHTIPGNFTLFSCIDCHEHDDPIEVGNDHTGVSGYSYSSPACFSCHPNGD